MIRHLLRLAGPLLLTLIVGCATVNEAAPPAAQTPPPPATTAVQPRSQFPLGPMRPLTIAEAQSGRVTFLEPPADLWERIRRGYAMPDLESDLVRDREQWYATRPDYLNRMTDRSSKYLFHIVEELERRGMPSELALLPFVESAFNPQAVSSAKAAGMWQFMPATGRTFELKQNAFRDDRRDVLESTRAALDYLQKLHRMFGDWHLALAAYNWGEGSVGRAIAKNQSRGLGTTYPELDMPQETRYYVPKLQALKNVVQRPDAFGMRMPPIGNHPYFQTVEVRRDIDVALVARLAEVSPADFRSLNPSYHRPVILAAASPQILLPWDNAEVFRRNLESYRGPLATWTAWVAPGTMKPAEVADRFGISEGELRQVNAIPPRMLIHAGSTLVVPRNDKVQQDVPEHVADNGQVRLAPEVVLQRTVVRAKRGETVHSLAQRHGLSAASVAGWNRLSPTAALHAGQSLVLFLPSGGASKPRAAATPAGRARVEAAPRKGVPRNERTTRRRR